MLDMNSEEMNSEDMNSEDMNSEERVDAAIDRIQKMSKEEFKALFRESGESGESGESREPRESGSATTISTSTVQPETKPVPTPEEQGQAPS